MKASRLCVLLSSLAALAAGCGDDGGDASFSVTPETAVVVAQANATAHLCFGADRSDATAQVSVTISDPTAPSTSVHPFTFPASSSGFSQCFDIQCQSAKDDYRVKVLFRVSSNDQDLANASATREVLCRGNGGGQQQTKCQAGEIQCQSSTSYRTCDASGNWSSELKQCGSEAPICAVNRCSSADVCLPVCAGEFIRRCSNDGVLLAADTCGDRMHCEMRGGAATCASTTDPGYTVSASDLRVYEGGTATFTVVLDAMPQSDVVVTPVLNTPEASILTSELTFTSLTWSAPQQVIVRAVRDGIADGDKSFDLRLDVQTSDSQYAALTPPTVHVTAFDTESAKQAVTGKTSVRFRAVAANITSGKYSSYGEGHGVRILKAIAPDIVMLQEFNWEKESDSDDVAMQLIPEAFGDGFYVHRGRGTIPNGIISRYPIIESGYWKSNKISNRDWDWAILDLPGTKELLVISVHLSTGDNHAESPSLLTAIENQIEADKNRNLEYFVMIGGDFNNNYKGNGVLDDIFNVKVTLPVDQEGDSTTNAARATTLDHLFVSSDFQKYEKDVVIAGHSYPNGHVFDTRVYAANGEIDKVPPALAKDSDADQMQHMAVIRDFEYAP